MAKMINPEIEGFILTMWYVNSWIFMSIKHSSY